ncbi:MAG: tRNA (cytidine(34)-2'-O)-methyltransferase [Candidatus Ancillula sp.]|jgi:tRNA (cytidine/uridine-2'-O-)-methyltransferase|nr:tRNA (cytidine(34)-2'-O)-methyltransferase [Candidatus Ancillula sp.]
MSAAPDIAFFEPRIPGNTGNAIRLSACVGNVLHLIEPLGFEMDDAKLKRAGLDYHELSHFVTHTNFDAFLEAVGECRIFAFSSHATTNFSDVNFRSDDVLLFGPEPTGLPEEILNHTRVTEQLRIPMQEGVRSLNLAVSASIAVYEGWRQLDFG